MYKLIIVGYDGSDRARLAVERAAALAKALSAKVHIVTAVDKDKVRAVGSSTDRMYLSDQELAKDHLQKVVPTLTAELDRSNVSFSTAVGGIVDVIVSEGERVGADLIVVGNKNVKGVARVLGSIATGVLKKAECAVLIENTQTPLDDEM